MAIDVVFWYSEEIVYKAFFTAESEEQAKSLMKQLEDGEITTDDLPDFYSKSKNYEVNFDKPMFFTKEGANV